MVENDNSMMISNNKTIIKFSEASLHIKYLNADDENSN